MRAFFLKGGGGRIRQLAFLQFLTTATICHMRRKQRAMELRLGKRGESPFVTAIFSRGKPFCIYHYMSPFLYREKRNYWNASSFPFFPLAKNKIKTFSPFLRERERKSGVPELLGRLAAARLRPPQRDKNYTRQRKY